MFVYVLCVLCVQHSGLSMQDMNWELHSQRVFTELLYFKYTALENIYKYSKH